LDKVEFDNGEIFNPKDNLTIWIKLSDEIKKLEPGKRIKIKTVANNDFK
jgi:hypothetical protein